MKSLLLILIISLAVGPANGQYAPPAGQDGSTAIYKDSTAIIDWAVRCDIIRGWVNIADTTLGRASYGDSTSAIGKADNSVVSLGDGGSATIYFDKPVANGPGYDFAIFENSFSDDFLELAFVEVSSDGEHFFRFDPVSLTQTTTQIGTFGTIDATKIHNLAGKYRANYGTPFNLDELTVEPNLNVDSIIAIRIIDVVGSIDEQFATFDAQGNKVNDPWPTPFETGGFDLDAIGVIHNTSNTSVKENKTLFNVTIAPNPCTDFVTIRGDIKYIRIVDITGRVLKNTTASGSKKIDLSGLPKGLLFMEVEGAAGEWRVMKLVRE